MRKEMKIPSTTFLFFAVFLSLVLAGCQNQLPPEPGSPSVPVGKATAIYDGYAPPKDVFDSDSQIMFLSKNVINMESGLSSIDVGVTLNHDGGFVYKYGYYYSNYGWQRFEFSDPTIAGSSWIKDKAAAYLNINAKDITPGENYIVAYSCKKYDGEWRCGCSSTGGPCNQWMLQTYLYRNVELPPEPIPPGGIITTRAYISPNWQIFKYGQEANPYVSLESTRDNLNDFASELTVRIMKPDYTSELVSLKKSADVSCYECPDDSCYRQFSCFLGFWGIYKPSLEGDYLIDFGKDGTPPEWMKIENGRFRVVSQSIFDEYLIESSIGELSLSYSGGYYGVSGQGFYAGYSSSSEKTGSVTVEVQDFKESFQTFQYFKNDPGSSFKVQNIEGNEVLVRTWESGEITWINVAWNNFGKLISIQGTQDGGYETVVSAYLKKYPSNNVQKGELYLILEDIGDFKFESLDINEPFYFTANYMNNVDLTNGHVSVSINPVNLDQFKLSIRSEIFEQLKIGESILYKQITQYPPPYGGYHSKIIWMSNGKMIEIDTSGPDESMAKNFDLELAGAYLKKHPSDNIIVELEHYPDILIEQDIGQYKYQRSILLDSGVDNKTKFYRVLYVYNTSDTNKFIGYVIKSDNQDYLDKLIGREVLYGNANLSKIEGQNVYLLYNGQFIVWTLLNMIVSTGVYNGGGIEWPSPIEITKAYLEKYPSTIPDNLTLPEKPTPDRPTIQPKTQNGTETVYPETAALKSSIFDVMKN